MSSNSDHPKNEPYKTTQEARSAEYEVQSGRNNVVRRINIIFLLFNNTIYINI